MTDNVLTISGIHKSFGGLKVIDNVSLDVRRGSRTALIGPNGAGKTTVFNLLTGVYPIDQGTVVLDGYDISHVPSQDRVIHGMSRSFSEHPADAPSVHDRERDAGPARPRPIVRQPDVPARAALQKQVAG